jgi:hypothetical protein
METSLHRQLKELYAVDGARKELALGRYRIDVACEGQLVEIQHGSLAAIRRKVQELLQEHRVLVVKPIVATKRLVKRASKRGPVVSRRLSPKRGQLVDLFHDLIYFRQVFPHPRLSLEVLLVEVEEWRYPGHGRRRRWRQGDCVVEDQKLLGVQASHRLETPADLRSLVDCPLPSPFHTGHLADALSVPRFVAQRVAYCFLHMGTARQAGKLGNARLYEFLEDTIRSTHAQKAAG